MDVSQHSEVSFLLVPSRNVVWTKDSGQSPDLEEQLQACQVKWFEFEKRREEVFTKQQL